MPFPSDEEIRDLVEALNLDELYELIDLIAFDAIERIPVKDLSHNDIIELEELVAREIVRQLGPVEEEEEE